MLASSAIEQSLVSFGLAMPGANALVNANHRGMPVCPSITISYSLATGYRPVLRQ
ncbi:hypothetical protein BURMUCGD2M_5040 [Burkholderia multivorans CGD2M]|uniref:Uncharacterized protein n=1 Tax=Burkholderia multivorans CGD2 TaxID=513052 RepID=B9BIZ1_9BURK|nr:hypothetical protein BURMUCGD2_5047 [Burkholderia multivorans CGD2]EEE15597.1 hypothetical protein BURMUCGD2M_5040 [Burkholderia multivorans CGD2M]